MHDIALTLGSFSLTWGQVAIGTAGGSLGLLLFLIVVLVRSRREGELEAALAAERAREMDDKVAEMIVSKRK